jgi:hypothetical protein
LLCRRGQQARVILVPRAPCPLAHRDCEQLRGAGDVSMRALRTAFLLAFGLRWGRAQAEGRVSLRRDFHSKRDTHAPLVLHGHQPFSKSTLQRISDARFHPTRFLRAFAILHFTSVGAGWACR